MKRHFVIPSIARELHVTCGFFAEFTLSARCRFLALLGMTSAGLGMTSVGLGMTFVAGEAAAQKPVLLQLRPRIGDTIWMRLEQQTELTNRRPDMKQAPALAGTLTITFSRAVVESGVAAATTVLAVTDSLFSANLATMTKSGAMTRQTGGQKVRLEIAPDGSMTLPSDNPQKAAARAPSLIPATFPAAPVAVGDRWTREAPLPAGASQLGASIVGWVKATFRLDSLTRDGELAWVSIDGKLAPDPAGARRDGVTMVDDGTVEGYMVLDRSRGWLTESRFTIVAHSTLKQPFGVASQPIRFEIKLTQSLKTLK